MMQMRVRAARVAALTIVGSLLVVAAAPTAHAQWTVTNLHPTLPGATASGATSIYGGQQGGYATIGGVHRAGLWSGSAISWLDIEPSGTTAPGGVVEGINGSQKTGEVHFGDAHASLWSGASNTWLDLHPTGHATSSYAVGSSGLEQVGFASVAFPVFHASLWTGNPGSWRDLNPAGATYSLARGVSNGLQAGQAVLSGVTRACIWHSTAGSWVDLHPTATGATFSEALGTEGGQQVGRATIGGVNHASLWLGTASSWIDLHPLVASSSRANRVFAGHQVGWATVGGVDRASLWNGTRGSWVDLGAIVPAGFTSSQAQDVWSDPSTICVVGWGFNSSTGRTEALLWKQTFLPSNDNCGQCLAVQIPSIVNVNNTCSATNDGSCSCDCGAGAKDVWYCITPVCLDPITINTCGSGFDTVLSVHSGCPGTPANEVACNDDATTGPCFGTTQSQLTFTPSACVTYYIRVAGCGTDCGGAVLSIQQPHPVPANNACAGAIALTPVINRPFSTCGATTDGPTDCPGFNDIWYTYTPPSGQCGYVDVSAFGGFCGFDPSISVYCNDACPAFGLHACSRDTVYSTCPIPPSGFASVRFYAEGGRQFKIRLGGAANTTGSGTLSLSFTVAALPNDLCSGATPIAAGQSISGGTWCATASDPGVCSPGNLDVWYVFSPACPGTYIINLCQPGLCGPMYDTVLSLYSACPASGGTEIACNDDFCGMRSQITFTTAVPCQTYYIRVAGKGGSRGDYRLSLNGGTVTPPPVNNPCTLPTPVTTGSYPFNTCGATTDGRANEPVYNDIWYRYQPTCAGTVAVSTCGSPIASDTSLAVYTGACGSQTLVAFNDNPTPPAFPCNSFVPPCLGTVQSYLQFTAAANTAYFIRVGSPIVGNYVCGQLNIVGPNPITPTCPPSTGPSAIRWFQVMGPSNNTPWAWCLSQGCCFSVSNLNVPGEPVISPVIASRNRLADDFATSIRNSCPTGRFITTAPPGSTLTPFDNVGLFSIKVKSCNATSLPFVFSVGSAGTPCASQCVVVDALTIIDPIRCRFNPEIREIPVSGLDCNANDQDDAIDILLGVSLDTNGDGIPDECQCPCDWNHDGRLGSQDFFDFVSAFFTGNADFNHNGITNSQDFFDFISCFFNPPAGCH